MARSYLPVDREQRFLLPPDMREWLPAGHLVHFVLEVVGRIDTTVLHDRRRLGGVGRRGYDPDMLLALLVYAYCTGQRSSRQIERLCEVDVAYRLICGGNAPDHSSIARFRQAHEQHAVQLFTDVLVVCAEAGLATVGVVAVDGTKMGTDAGLKANRTRAWIEAEVARMLADAEAVDAEQERLFGAARGDELPAELLDPGERARRLDAALQVVARRHAVVEANEAVARVWVAKAWAAATEGRGVVGPVPKGVDPVEMAQIRLERARQKARRRRARIEARAAAEERPVPGYAPGRGQRVAGHEAAVERARQAQTGRSPADAASEQGGGRAPVANITDPASRPMKTGNGWVQGYNAQAAVNDQGIVVAAKVTQDHNDVDQLVPMIAALLHSLAAAGIDVEVGIMLFDAGYWSQANATAEGPDRLIATAKDRKRRQHIRGQGLLTGPPPQDATVQEAMEHRLCTAEGAALYAKRATTVEPVFGQGKHNRGFRRFVRRGLAAAQAEWLLIHATGNLLKVFRHQHAAPATA